jgi:ABC-2 type transport system permease protein
MNSIITIYKRELQSYFNSPMAYMFLSVFLVLSGWFFFSGFFVVGQADLRGMLEMIPLMFIFFVPAITMRLISEEKGSGTLELLVTYPIHDHEVIIGKFLAAFTLLLVAIMGTMSYTLTVSSLGNLDGGTVITGYLGMILMGAAYTSIGVFASSLTNNQFVGFVLGIVMIFGLFMLDKVLYFVPAGMVGIFEFLSIDTHYHSLIRGVIDTRDLVYYGSLITLGLYLAAISLSKRKWS